MRKKQAAVEWIDALDRVLPKMVVPIMGHRGTIKLRLLGVRNVGTRTLHDLYLRSEYKGVNKTEFQLSGTDRWEFFLDLFLGCLAPGNQVRFWVKETFQGVGGPSSRIYIEEG